MKTKQGVFDEKYHHIEAPTACDNERSKKLGHRVLSLPWDFPDKPKIWRSPEVEYLSNNEWFYKRKLDGENMRVFWDGEKTLWNGKSNDFLCDASTSEMMNSTFLEEIFEEKFDRNFDVVLFGERMGPKCQDNELALEKTAFVLFDAKVNGTWLEPKNIASIAKYFDIPSCYDFMANGSKIDCEIYSDTLVNLIKKTNDGDFKDWEGIVAIPKVRLYDQRDERIIVKIKNKDYFDSCQQ